ncbi:MAG: porin [Casimicrobiaceae bacterium]
MNKKLVALAVGGALALPFAVQAQTANVTLYGRLNLDLEFVKGSTCDNASVGTAIGATSIPVTCDNRSNASAATSISNPTVNRVSSNSSRFGMRGTESLGGGLNAVFQIESNVSGDTSNSSGSGLASRETFVGLQGGWGRVIMGNFLMPMDDLHPMFGNAPTFTTSILSTATLWAYGTVSKNTGGFDARVPNSIRYDTPNMMGFTAAVQYATMDDSGASNTSGNSSAGSHPQVVGHAYVIGGNLIYSNGPLVIGAGGEVNRGVRTAFTAGGPNLRDTDWSVAGSYNFGTIFQGFGLQIGAVYEQTRYSVQAPAISPGGSSNAGSGCVAGANSGTCSLNRNFFGVSATVPLGGGKIYGFYGKATNGRGSAPDGTAVGMLVRGGQTGAQQWELSYTYALSPRTSLYAGYVSILNECKAAYTFNINSYAVAVGSVGAAAGSAGDFCSGRPQGAVFGMIHTF